MLKFLIFGDIVGRTGRQALQKILPSLKKQYKPNLVIANAENAAHGSGVTHKTLREMQLAGVDFFTNGDHCFDKPEVEQILTETDSPLLRPANMVEVTGVGEKLLTLATKKVLVVNLLGRVFIENNLEKKGEDKQRKIKLSNPFTVMEEILAKYADEKIDAILLDFHTEATSEQVAMGYFLDGRVAAVWGTHTHVPTADARILSKGTGFITDVGMTGAKDTVIGVAKENVIERFVKENDAKFEWPETEMAMVNALYVEVDPKTKNTKKIKLIQKEIKI
ncbi:MAG: YmdB family metallophosphoesterase [Candidatus Magasanikbacteria bacterium]|nr:YmdB family metallophosphoesterase [Candidatus Magasanikbacteria bacterium]